MTPDMTPDELKRHVDLYSADLSRWPQDKIKPALALMEEDAAAKAHFDEALALDDTLRFYLPEGKGQAALEEKIMRAIRQTRQEESPGFGATVRKLPALSKKVFAWRPAYLFAPGSGLLAVAVLGFLVGFHPMQAETSFLDPSFYTVEAGKAAAAQDMTIDEGDIY